MIRAKFNVKGDGYDKMRRWMLAFEGKYENAIKKATQKACFYMMGEIVREIKRGNYEANTPLTLFLKEAEGYGKKPLMRTGGLVRAINYEVIRKGTGLVGLMKQRKNKDGSAKDFTNIGYTLHEGATIKLTEAMKRNFARKMAAALKKKSGGSAVRPYFAKGSSGAGTIKIKPRPFIKKVFEDPKHLAKIEKIVMDTLKKELGF